MSAKVFIFYSTKDEEFREVLENKLIFLRKLKLVESWRDRQIIGRKWDGDMYPLIDNADIVLLLISHSFLASEFCYSKDINRAIERHQAGTAKVIPLMIYPIRNWVQTPFAELEVLPQNGLPILDWPKEEEAFLDIAVGIGERVLELTKSTAKSDPTERAIAIDGLATLYKKQEKYQEAESLYLQALEIFESNGDRLEYAKSVTNLASLYQAINYYFEAEPLYKEALKIRRELLGENSLEYVESINNVAMIYYFQERYNKAEPLYQEALELRKNLLGEDSLDVAKTLNNLAAVYSSQKMYKEAEPLYKEAYKIMSEKLGKDHPKTITIRRNLDSHRNKSFWTVVKWYLIFQTLYEIFV